MPIRDMDTFGFWPATRTVRVAANRGASGIDGLVATAMGFAVGLNRPVTALVGDLSLLHDLNSLALVAKQRPAVLVILINNNGGGIFDFLPVARQSTEFERFFTTTHGLRLENAARLFDLDYSSPATMAEFESDYQNMLAAGRPALLEVRTDRQQNRELHRQVEQAIQGAEP
jgi:2-succinyl-5-enolpyruvyl-6-hydroxy-3-cyclohexene-1-carboxylate synthase